MPPPRIALVMGPWNNLDQILPGIERARRALPVWDLVHWSAPTAGLPWDHLATWRPDGALLVQGGLRLGGARPRLPMIGVHRDQGAQSLLVDELAVGRAAGEHLLAQGFRSFAWASVAKYGEGDFSWGHRRRQGCAEVLAAQGRRLEVIHLPPPDQAGDLEAEITRLARPCGVFVGNDWFAHQFLNRILALGLRVPADVGIVGADDHPLSAQLRVPLSSVRVPHAAAGELGARSLADLLAGRKPEPARVLLSPDGVAVRSSSALGGVDDPEVAAVLAYLRTHASEPISAAEALAMAGCCRRSAEQRFRAQVGRSVLAELTRLRLELARERLRHSDDSIGSVAAACGFADPAWFAVVFQRVEGMAPLAWRRAQSSA